MTTLPAQFYPSRFTTGKCETYACLNRVKWSLGRPDAPASQSSQLCQSCTESIVKNLPPELLAVLMDNAKDVQEHALVYNGGIIAKIKSMEPLEDVPIDDLRELGKEAHVHSYHLKKQETLITDLRNIVSGAAD